MIIESIPTRNCFRRSKQIGDITVCHMEAMFEQSDISLRLVPEETSPPYPWFSRSCLIRPNQPAVGITDSECGHLEPVPLNILCPSFNATLDFFNPDLRSWNDSPVPYTSKYTMRKKKPPTGDPVRDLESANQAAYRSTGLITAPLAAFNASRRSRSAFISFFIASGVSLTLVE